MKNIRAKRCATFTLATVVGAGMLCPSAGCLTLEQMAPPVEGIFQTVAAREGVDVITLELGRQVYLSDCVKCHGVEPVGRYSSEQWREILPRMSLESKLDEGKTEALEAYVTMAHKLLQTAAYTERTGREPAVGAGAADLCSDRDGG